MNRIAPNTKLRVYVLAAGNERGGAATHLLTLARYAQQARMEYHFLLWGNGPLSTQLSEIAVEQTCLEISSLRHAKKRICQMLQSDCSAILHSHGPRLNVIAAQIAKQTGVPFTSTIHSNPYLDYLASRWKSIIYPQLHLYSLRRAMGLFVVSEAFAPLLPVKDVAFVPNALDLQIMPSASTELRSILRKKIQIPLDTPLVGIAARFDPVKNIPLLLRAFAQMNNVSAHLVIAGDGPLRKEYEQMVESLGLQQRVHFLGFWQSMKDFYAALDWHVLPSKSEGLPSAILEAGATGVPTIGSDIAGILQLIEHEKTGYIVKEGDSKALAVALDYCLEHPQLRRRLVDAFQAEVLPRYRPEKMLESYARGYEWFLGWSPVTYIHRRRTGL
ncbi:glycosyltransferase family 4 protein [Alicyclobacillus tolerans]|uniref:glycosyltransferase family 4 protein n=1 Tax=Alicyclobacillus tolerans TaxID=90970 RepID=UPI003B7EA3C2